MHTITPKKEGDKKKRGEVLRLIQLMEYRNMEAVDLAKVTDVSERTIKNCIWDNSEIGGRLLRGLHLKMGVSVDWILSGEGDMFAGIKEPSASYEDSRSSRMVKFIKKWMSEQSDDEKAWLEVQFSFAVPPYKDFLLERNSHEQ